MLRYCLYCCLLLAAACKKNNTGPLLNGVYQSEPQKELSEAVMYTASGRVTDQTAIAAFLQRQGAGANFALNSKTQSTQGFFVKFVFQSELSAQFNTSANIILTEVVVGKTNDNELLLTHKDSVQFPGGPGLGGRCDTLNSFVRSIEPIKKERAIPLGGTVYIFQPRFALRIQNNRLYLPLLSYLVQTSNPPFSFCRQTIKDEWNLAKTIQNNQLAARDTIVVQESKLWLQKQ